MLNEICKKLASMNSTNRKNHVASQAPDVSMKHLLERREGLGIHDEIWKFPSVDGWKAFVVHIKNGVLGKINGEGSKAIACNQGVILDWSA